MIQRINYDPPVAPGINCRYCGQPVVVVAEIRSGWADDGVNVCDPYPSFDWRHEAKLKRECQPIMRAEVFDYYKAVAAVRAALAGRGAAGEALAVALSDE